MKVEVEIGGRIRQVELERKDDRWHASLDGRELFIDAVQVRTGCWSLLVSPPDTAARASFDIRIENRAAGELTVHVGRDAFSVRVPDVRAAARRGREQNRSGAGAENQVTAPMPGRVVRVLVRPGDRVATRQGLVVVEAMKMENELRAPAEATVREVRVVEGTSVEAGAVLVVLE